MDDIRILHEKYSKVARDARAARQADIAANSKLSRSLTATKNGKVVTGRVKDGRPVPSEGIRKEYAKYAGNRDEKLTKMGGRVDVLRLFGSYTGGAPLTAEEHKRIDMGINVDDATSRSKEPPTKPMTQDQVDHMWRRITSRRDHSKNAFAKLDAARAKTERSTSIRQNTDANAAGAGGKVARHLRQLEARQRRRDAARSARAQLYNEYMDDAANNEHDDDDVRGGTFHKGTILSKLEKAEKARPGRTKIHSISRVKGKKFTEKPAVSEPPRTQVDPQPASVPMLSEREKFDKQWKTSGKRFKMDSSNQARLRLANLNNKARRSAELAKKCAVEESNTKSPDTTQKSTPGSGNSGLPASIAPTSPPKADPQPQPAPRPEPQQPPTEPRQPDQRPEPKTNPQPQNTSPSGATKPKFHITGKQAAGAIIAAGGVTAAGLGARYLYKKRQERKRKEREAAESRKHWKVR